MAAGEPRRGVDPRDSLLFWWLKNPRLQFHLGVAGGAALAGEGKSGKDSIFARTLSRICAGRVGSSVTSGCEGASVFTVAEASSCALD